MLPALAGARRVVVKIGSALVVEEKTAAPRAGWLASVAADVAALRARGTEVILVSSGAIALARRALGLTRKKLKLEEKQAAAAVGQIRLAGAWADALSAQGLSAAQLLLTLEDSEDRRRYLNARATLGTLLELGCIPVINENDTVATAEIRFGDNDRLAARVAEMTGADALILLSDIDGLYTADPRKDPAAAHLPVVERITDEIMAMGGDPPPGYSSGGMRTKLIAARIATGAGCAMAIALGQRDNPLRAIEDGRALHLVPGLARRPLLPQALDRRLAGAARQPGGRCRRGARPGARILAVAGRRPGGGGQLPPRRPGQRAGRGGARAGARPGGLRRRGCAADRRPSQRGTRKDPRLAWARRDRPPRRPRADARATCQFGSARRSSLFSAKQIHASRRFRLSAICSRPPAGSPPIPALAGLGSTIRDRARGTGMRGSGQRITRGGGSPAAADATPLRSG